MSVLGSIGKAIGKAGQQVGKVAGTALKVAAPLVSNVPILGQMAAPVMAGVGNTLQGHNLGSSLKEAALATIPLGLGKIGSLASSAVSHVPQLAGLANTALGKAATGALGSAVSGAVGGGGPNLPVPGLPAGVKIGGGGPSPTFPGSSPVPSVGGAPQSSSKYGMIGDLARDVLSGGKPLTIGNVGATVGKGAQAVGGAIGNAIDYAKDNPSTILAGASAASGALDAARASDLRNQALKDARGSYDERAGLRTKAMNSLTSPAKVDLSAQFADPGNVYARSSSPSIAQAPPGSLAHASQAAAGQRTPSSDPATAQAKAVNPNLPVLPTKSLVTAAAAPAPRPVLDKGPSPYASLSVDPSVSSLFSSPLASATKKKQAVTRRV